MRRSDRRGGDDAVAAFRAWLGPAGFRPPPMDRFLSRERPPAAVVAAVDRLARRAVSLLADPEPGGPALWTQLRSLPAAALAGAAGTALPGAVVRARAEARTWSARCAAFGIPPGFAPLLERRAATWGPGPTRAWLEALDRRPPLWIRVRDPAALGALRSRGFTVREDGAAAAVAGEGDPRVVMRDGGFEIQDRASQEVAEVARPAPGQRAWDVCAGRGGKTMAMADALAGRGLVVATDVDERALAELRTRARRAGVADVVRVRAWDGREPPDFGPEARRGFDVVLVDAPCSASGTWRRDPDARLRTDPAGVPALATLQARLLAVGASRVGAGGRLVYATCSVFAEEDEDVTPGPGWTRTEGRLFGSPERDADTLYASGWTRA